MATVMAFSLVARRRLNGQVGPGHFQAVLPALVQGAFRRLAAGDLSLHTQMLAQRVGGGGCTLTLEDRQAEFERSAGVTGVIVIALLTPHRAPVGRVVEDVPSPGQDESPQRITRGPH